MTESTNTITAVAAPGSTANRHGWVRAHRAARLARRRTTTLPPATVNSATVPADSELVRPTWPPMRCSRRSAPVTTTPAAPATAQGTSAIAAVETVSSSRRLRPCSSLRSGVDIATRSFASGHEIQDISLLRFALHLDSADQRRPQLPANRIATTPTLVEGCGRAQSGRNSGPGVVLTAAHD